MLLRFRSSDSRPTKRGAEKDGGVEALDLFYRSQRSKYFTRDGFQALHKTIAIDRLRVRRCYLLCNSI